MADDNQWKQPENPPPPLFTGQKEREFVKQVNDELLERVIGQQILYYPINMESTDFHPLYGEAPVKNFLPPVRVYVLVTWDGHQTKTENYGIDKRSSLTLHFHNKRLVADQDLYVREGDYVKYGEFFYEIVSWSLPELLFGQIEHKIQISAKCIRARESAFNGE